MRLATEEVGSARTMNMVLAGALSVLCPFEEGVWLKAMEELLAGPKAKFIELNERAFAVGRRSVAA